MTIKIPHKNFLDKILKLFRKERKIIIPEDSEKIYQNRGPYVQIRGKRESFFKTLFCNTAKRRPTTDCPRQNSYAGEIERDHIGGT